MRLLSLVLIAGATVCIGSATAAFPGANGRIAYLRGPTLNVSALHVASADGSADVALPITQATGVSWSPDGRKLAWSGDFHQCGSIYVSNADGTATTQALPNCGVNWGGKDPVWSPDGRKLAFWMYHDSGPPFNTSSIYVVDLASKALVQLTPGGLYDQHPAWSPDGSKIAFTRARQYPGTYAYGPDDIWSIDPDGGGARNLTGGSGVNVEFGGIDWSPDGTRIAFTGDDHGFCCPNVMVAASDGSGARALTFGDRNSHNGNPVWSPDGTRIAYTSDARDPNGTAPYDLYVMNADGSGGTKVVSDAWRVAWGPPTPPTAAVPTAVSKPAPPAAKARAHEPPRKRRPHRRR